MKTSTFWVFPILVTTLFGAACQAAAERSAILLPAPVLKETSVTDGRHETAVFAGGCFWGVQSVFQHVRGVTATRAGYDGGSRSTAEYDVVSGGGTGHAESVEVEYDPAQVSYSALLRVFFSVALDPTQADGQFPDEGSQYRSVLFARTQEQAVIARAYIAQLEAGHAFSGPIATALAPDKGFYPAEAEHQNFAARYPYNPYIAAYDAPRVAALKSLFGAVYRDDPVLTLAGAG